ncbi:peptidase M48, Ste24p [Psychromonas ingrahamii 37]|uniref:Putative beta-barrel assembly-enhancing protease n=1 Tax=Psychromonas ingrahamii (strain DSM 17664 / CCUG 51855 / 37) TaxID=357804 RepID=A1STF3_PSYIN|nr:M48 family metalloprotease [Psychromonas ingrahamii]ABM02768.1 peptidase M48, Ste24p [Psychromonas ingrahamii 37]
MLNKSLLLALYFFLSFFSGIANSSNALPEIGTVGAATLSIEKEQEYGWAFRLMANQSLPIIHDPVLNQYINELGQSLVSHAESVRMPFDFFLIEDNEINAAAFLGGNVKIHTGLFLYAKNESELASVIAHEIAHITQRHLARMLEQQSSNTPTSLAAMAGSILLTLVSPAAGMAALTTTMAVSIQSQINYTRTHEYEADRIGIKTLADAGYDPNGMAQFFGELAEKYKYASLPPKMLSTHPLPEARLSEARLRASQYKTKNITNSLDYQLSKARITVRFSSINPTSAINLYESQLKKQKYEIKEAALYGLALAYFENKDFLQAQDIINDLLKAQSGNLFYIDLATDTALALNKADEIIEKLQQLYKKSPDNPVYTINLVAALQEDKRYADAEKILELFIRSHPRHILAQIIAVDLYRLLNNRAKEHASKAQYLALQGRFKEAIQEVGNALIYTENPLDKARYAAMMAGYQKDNLRLQALTK